VHIDACVQDAIRAVQKPSAIQIETHGLDDLPAVMAGRQSLMFVFRNLFENAMAAMNGQGLIVVHGGRHGDWVEVSVSDAGPGIPHELHDQIFELNFSGRSGVSAGKLGFGLWWVKSLMTRLGGHVTVESDGVRGTTFRLHLPLVDVEREA
jgi:signal transduction histidine kinase